MSKKVSDDMIYKLERLSGFILTDSEREIIKLDMENMIEYIEILNEVDKRDIAISNINTDNINENNIKSNSMDISNTHKEYINNCITRLENIYREDVVINNDKELLDNMSNKEERYIVVPKTI